MRRLVFLMVLLFDIVNSFANSDFKEILVGMGMENVKVVKREKTLYAEMQPTAYRSIEMGLADAIKELGKSDADIDSLVIVASENRIPKVCIRVGFSDNENGRVTVDYDMKRALDVLNRIKVVNSSAGKVDVVIDPQISLDNHRFDILFETVINIAPYMKIDLWKGANITAQVVFPIWNNIEGECDNIRPGFVTFAQDVSVNDRFSVKGTIGLFNNNRAGANVALKYQLNNALTLIGEAGITGRSEFKDRWETTEWKRVDATLGLSYFEKKSQLQVEAFAKRFVYGYWGATTNVVRHFADYTIGGYATLVQGGHNAGFLFAFPIQGKRPYKRKGMRVKLPDYFDWQYNMVSNNKEWKNNHVKSYETIPDYNNSSHYWQAEWIEKEINRYLNR